MICSEPAPHSHEGASHGNEILNHEPLCSECGHPLARATEKGVMQYEYVKAWGHFPGFGPSRAESICWDQTL